VEEGERGGDAEGRGVGEPLGLRVPRAADPEGEADGVCEGAAEGVGGNVMETEGTGERDADAVED
jgi:hypothetical protein